MIWCEYQVNIKSRGGSHQKIDTKKKNFMVLSFKILKKCYTVYKN